MAELTQELLNNALYRADGYYVRHEADCERIALVARRHGLGLTLKDAEKIWSRWSESVAAGWLFIDDDDEIMRAISAFVDARGK